MIQDLIHTQPDWHRSRLSQELCTVWNWTNEKGQLKDMACRTMLLKLERRGYFRLPAPRSVAVGNARKPLIPVTHDTSSLTGSLHDLLPLQFEVVQTQTASQLFQYMLATYHYLGFSGSVGQNMKYLVRDRHGRPLACLLFGSAAWNVASRDTWIGWTPAVRRQSLPLVTNNMRYLIFPWVTIPHLASHILGRIARRIHKDWLEKYGHPIHLLETFVEQGRFRGTCYQAANWICVGQTQGRSRNDTHHALSVPRKDVYLYPLTSQAVEVLRHGT
jgi:hypothetical protein